MDNYSPSTYGDRMADVYDRIQGNGDASAAAAFLAELCAQLPDEFAPVLELGIGTGRVALPLAARGIEVHGIDASPAMLEQLGAKAGSERINTILGDFADMSLEGRYKIIFAVFGTFFCLPSQEDQIQCLKQVALHLTPDGLFVLQASVPDFSGFVRNQNVRVSSIEMDRVIVTITEHDPVTQRTTTQHIMITEQGIRLMPVCVRYAWPNELDAMAQVAGLVLRERWADWTRAPFGSTSRSHVSVYGKNARQIHR